MHSRPFPRAILALIATLFLSMGLAPIWQNGVADEPARRDASQNSTEENSQQDSSKESGTTPRTDGVEKVLLTGEVVWLPEAFRRRGVKSYKEEIEKQAVLLTDAGDIIPLVPDWRGRAFFQDERLRDRPVELVANRRPGVPWVNVLSIYATDEDGKRAIVDYWCDVCSIPMYEIKDCECCQGPTRLRFRKQSLPKDAKPIASASSETSRK